MFDADETSVLSPVSTMIQSVAFQPERVADDRFAGGFASAGAGLPPNELAGRAMTIFAFLWACAALFHQAAYPSGFFKSGSLLIVLPALWVLLKPDSLVRFSVALALQVVQVWRTGPVSVTNHWVFTTFVNLTILFALARLLWVKRGGRVERSELFVDFAPVVRIELLILYFFAVLHKLNTDFLNPAFSCATTHYAKLGELFTFMPKASWVPYAVIYGTLAIETAIPILLCVRRTRLFGVLLAALFHLLLALNPGHMFFDFSSMLFAMYFLFVPYDFWSRLRTIPGRTGEWLGANGPIIGKNAKVIGGGVIALLLIAYFVRPSMSDPRFIRLVQESVRVLWAVFAAVLILIFIFVMRSTAILPAVRGIDSLSLPRLSSVLVPALLLFYGMSPYFGLKTEASFSMFSNLRTEDGRSNHLFMPPQLKAASYQDDLVQVIDSSNPALKKYAEQKLLLVYLEFRKLANKDRNASVTYFRDGQLRTVARVADDPVLSRPPSPLLLKFLSFRPVDPPGVGTPCRH